MTEDRATLIRAIRGPVIMITVGVLFALDQLTSYSFSQTWPIILIVAGLLSLTHWMGTGTTPGGPSAT